MAATHKSLQLPDESLGRDETADHRGSSSLEAL